MKEANVNNYSYSLSSFMGSNYLAAVPSSAQDIVSHTDNPLTATYAGEFYPSVATHILKVSKNKLIGEGQQFSASEAGSLVAFSGIVLSYNPVTGELIFKVDYTSNQRRATNWVFYFGLKVKTYSYASSLANGLTGATGFIDLKEKLELHNIKSPWIIFEDFGAAPGFDFQSSMNGITWTGEGDAGISGGNLTLTADSASSLVCAYLGQSGFFTIATVKPSCRYEALITTPSALSSAFKRYTIAVGLKGQGSTDANPFTVGGMGFTYTYSANAGAWVGVCSNNGVSTTINSAVTVTASTTYRLTILVASGTASFYINGALIGTSTNVPVANSNNLMLPLVGVMTTSPWTGSASLVADYIYLEIYGD